jgi:hypothetical protein
MTNPDLKVAVVFQYSSGTHGFPHSREWDKKRLFNNFKPQNYMI